MKNLIENIAPPALIEYSKRRSEEFVKKLRTAMAAVELEIEKNDGLYPFHGGRLSQAEICRRAGVTQVALQGASHKTTTKIMVDEWLNRVTTQMKTGQKIVRRAITDRADAWKAQHSAIANAYHKVELELIDMNNRIHELESENNALREQLSKSNSSKVISLLRPS